MIAIPLTSADCLPLVARWNREQAEHWFLYGHLHQYAEALELAAQAGDEWERAEEAKDAVAPLDCDEWVRRCALASAAHKRALALEHRARTLRALVEYRLGNRSSYTLEDA